MRLRKNEMVMKIMKTIHRTQSKYSKDRKSGGVRTYKTCNECGNKTKGIWKYRGCFYCYQCYAKKLKIGKGR